MQFEQSIDFGTSDLINHKELTFSVVVVFKDLYFHPEAWGNDPI